MALYCLRLRRTLTSLSTLHRSLSTVPAIPAISTPALQGPTSTSTSTPSHPWALLVQSRPFRFTTVALFSARSSYNNNSTDEIGPDTILFEGCDYNHWLIVMTFPKDDKPTPEQMVQTYEETCAKGLNISVEEAKQKIYACSTTTYEGFQAVMTEEESNKFQGLPGVTFVLPDSYIDPVNKEYGGDKYVNGTIIPRPPPVQYWKQGRNRSSPDRRYGREGPPPTNQQYRPSNDYQVSRDGRNHGAPQNYPSQQNYAPPGPGERRDSMPMNRNQGAPQNYPSQQNYAPPGPGERRDPMPMNRNQGAPQNYPSQQNYAPPGPGERRDPMPTSRNYAPGGMGTYQSGRGDPIPPYQGNYNPGGQGDYSPQQQRDFPQGDQSHYVPPAQGNFVGANRSYGPSQDGTYGRGAAGYQGQETYRASGQGASSGYERNYPGHGEGQRFSQEEQRNWQGEQRTNAPRGPAGPTGSDQGRY